ncbi:ATP-dependent helicase/nuclease subunit B [Polaromonas sp. OV174]|uniref:PD-(D/E)XK nuclease family protein n=1 Tax=Polaromonas sp. OV174 TaxID=1855300 RepID=UPI0008EE7C67|nr:PD-(D/E)XK nuclease family protein [Polaromonas sp. OV174]SFC36266.1 ATP-dependent helicase/nuclease subunit B [Polaromonas sp. OV174]
MPLPDSLDAAASLAQRCWQQAMTQLAEALQVRGVHPAEAVVLLPYVQLIPYARQAWAAQAQQAGGTFFVPRFETTMNWATAQGGTLGLFTPSGDDLRMDVAVDTLTAASLLGRAGLGAQQEALAGRLVEAAWSLGRVAAAVLPTERQAWSERLAVELGVGLDSPVLALEAAVGSVALAWAAASAYPTDRLFQAQPVLLVVLEGFQTEPLTEALKAHFGERSHSIALCPSADWPDSAPAPALHAARDAEDEAEQAAACVLAHLAQGRKPVALIAQDRQLTRRVGAMLAQQGIAMRDETGWKLSTTRAAAALMSLLRAMPWDASTDAVLDWLKNAPAFARTEVTAAETELRKAGVRAWRELPVVPLPSLAAIQALALPVNTLRETLVRARPLMLWLRDLRAALQAAGQWEVLMLDDAGQTVLEVLRLHEGAETEFETAPTMKLNDFSSWVNQALEGGKYSPAHPQDEQVVILPLAQLLGRPMQAVVLPGCDEVRLPVSPEPPGQWTPSQRELLGLPSREALTSAARQAWHYGLQLPRVDVLWRSSEGGEHLMPSGFVQELLLLRELDPATDLAPDQRSARAVAAQPTPRPLPSGEALPVSRLSASSYDDLRRCPYRFFALRQFKLQESDELESELGKRDFGNWLHGLLRHFHEALQATPTSERSARLRMIDAAAELSTKELGLSDSEFLPFAAAWAPVRDGYLDWLVEHEATGAQFESAESWHEMPLGELTLLGKMDRIDRHADGHILLLDYKTEPRTTTAERIKNGQEDTQLAFYAALMADDTLAAAYVNLGEKEPTRTYEQPDIVELRDGLIDSILLDMARIAQGAVLPALGEGKACDYCAARGLCRKDFWNE